MKKRMLSQDIAKGLGILIVVQNHSLQLTGAALYSIVAIFGYVMPFFIFMAGFNYHRKDLTPVQMMKKRVLALLKTYALWTAGIFIVMGTYFYFHKDGTLQEILRSFLASVLSDSGCKMIGWKLPVSLFQHVLGPYWFFQYLITASVIFHLTVDYALRTFRATFSVVTLMLAVTFLLVQLHITLPWGLHCAPALAAMMITGAKLGENNRLFSMTSRKSWIIANSLACIVIVDMIQIFYPAAGLLGAGLLGEVAGGTEVVFAMCFAVLGSYFIINFSTLLEKIPVISKGLIWCGQHTLIILCLHRPVAYIIRDIMNLPHFISGDPLYIDRITPENFAAFLLVFVIMVPVIMAWDRIKKSRRGD